MSEDDELDGVLSLCDLEGTGRLPRAEELCGLFFAFGGDLDGDIGPSKSVVCFSFLASLPVFLGGIGREMTITTEKV